MDLKNEKKFIRGQRAFKNSYFFSLTSLVYLLLSPLKCSLQLEIYRFFKKQSKMPSKSAFVQARRKISYRLFKELHSKWVEEFALTDCSEHYKGYKLVGVDGTTIYLPQTEGCRRVFGSIKNQHGSQSYSRCCLMVDLLAGYCLAGKMGRCYASELNQFRSIMDKLPKNSISVFDRLYAGTNLFFELIHNNHKFIIRCKTSFNNTLKAFIKEDIEVKDVEMPLSERAITQLKSQGYQVNSKTRIKVRLVRVLLPNKKYEYLITNVLDSNFTIDDYREIYNLRWGIETAIDTLKNKLRLEHFSGHLPSTIRQDFYASLMKYNFAIKIYNEAQKNLNHRENKKKNNLNQNERPKRKINKNMAVNLTGDLIRNYDVPEKELIEQIKVVLEVLVRFPEPVRPNRTETRKTSLNKARGRCWYNTNFKYSS